MKEEINKTRYRGFEEVSYNKIIKHCIEVQEKNSLNVFACEKVILPSRGTKNSAGYDFYNNYPTDIEIQPYSKVLIWTNVKAYMQPQEVLILDVRSSIGIKKDLILSNTLGIIDADYYNNRDNEGNIGISIRNLSSTPVIIKSGERIAQGIFVPFLESDNCNSDSERIGGIGSTSK